MADTITCSNPKCRTAIGTAGREVGEMVACPKCGTKNQVLAEFGSVFDISTLKPVDDAAPIQHPARQKCPNCGAVLGVRAVVCPNCHADIRTGGVVAQPQAAQRKSGAGASIWLVVGILGFFLIVAAVAVVLLLVLK